MHKWSSGPMGLRRFGAIGDLGLSMFWSLGQTGLGRLGQNGRLKHWGIWPMWDSAHLLCHTIPYYAILFRK